MTYNWEFLRHFNYQFNPLLTVVTAEVLLNVYGRSGWDLNSYIISSIESGDVETAFILVSRGGIGLLWNQ